MVYLVPIGEPVTVELGAGGVFYQLCQVVAVRSYSVGRASLFAGEIVEEGLEAVLHPFHLSAIDTLIVSHTNLL